MAINKINSKSIEDLDLSADDLAPGTITGAKIAPATVESSNIAPGTIANDRLANTGITINGTSIALGASGEIIAGTDWQTVKTTDFNAVAGEGYFVDTNSVGAVTATLPGSPSAGDTIAFKDYAANFGTNALTIARNGNNIQGVANDSEISTNRASIVLVYIDATKGWLYTNESNVADLGKPLFTVATGGTITTSGDYKIHSFTGDGCFAVTQLGNSPTVPTGGPQTVSYLVVAGGGGAGPGHYNGGGGAGGFREGRDIAPSYTASPLVSPTGLTITATTYPVTVGGGGSGTSNGSDSIFSTITSAGGGQGGGPGGVVTPGIGTTGGSGGGGSTFSTGTPQTGSAGNTPPVSPSQGNPGGTGFVSSPPGTAGSGGGGGATAAGGNSTSGNPLTGGAGGAGATTSISGSPTAYAGGGGGSSYLAGNVGGTGGVGGGGNGGVYPNIPSAQNGTANTGGGAGGDAGFTGPTGGKGIVLIRYKFQ